MKLIDDIPAGHYVRVEFDEWICRLWSSGVVEVWHEQRGWRIISPKRSPHFVGRVLDEAIKIWEELEPIPGKLAYQRGT